MTDYSQMMVGGISISPLPPGDPAQPDFRCREWRDMELHWRLLEALCGGTAAMREAGPLYLPAEPEEEPIQYSLRLNRSFLHEAYSDTLDKINSKPFSSPIKIDGLDTLDERVQRVFTNADYEGSSITDFWARVFYGVEKYGLNHVLVEAPDSDESKTLQDELQQDLRPYFVEISPTKLVGWKSAKINGIQQLTQIRFIEERSESENKFGDTQRKYIRVINSDGTYQLYKESDYRSNKYNEVKSGRHTFKGIPLRTWYGKKTGFMTAMPPLEKLAWLNLMHWQSQSDQRNILRIARVGMLFLKCMGEDSPNKKNNKFVVAANTKLASENENADVKWVEHSGKAIEAGRFDLTDIEEKMVMMGMEPFVQRSGDSSATGKVIRESHRMSRVQAWIKSGDSVLYECVNLANIRTHDDKPETKLPKKFFLKTFNEYSISMQAFEDMRLLLEAARVDKISDRLLLSEFDRRSMLGDNFDLESEVERVTKLREDKLKAGLLNKQGSVPPKRQKGSRVGSQKTV